MGQIVGFGRVMCKSVAPPLGKMQLQVLSRGTLNHHLSDT